MVPWLEPMAAEDGRNYVTATACMPRLILRRARFIGDCLRLWRWRNEPSTRAMMRNTREFGLLSHASWLWRTLRRNDRALFVVEELGVPVGTGRLNFGGAAADVSITISQDHRGRGLAMPVIALLVHEAWMAGALLCVAEARASNEPSVRAFLSAGFEREAGQAGDEFVVLWRGTERHP